jgi:hypothetical protein
LQKFNDVFSENLIELSNDENGISIVIKYISLFEYPINQFVYTALLGEFIDLATHKQGCFAIKKLIERANDTQKEEIIKHVIQNTQDLIRDQYGNYVLQDIIEKDPAAGNAIVDIFIGNIVYLSKQKYSSNVIEKVNFFNYSSLTFAKTKLH